MTDVTKTMHDYLRSKDWGERSEEEVYLSKTERLVNWIDQRIYGIQLGEEDKDATLQLIADTIALWEQETK
jgi:hypothetical protein